MSMADDFWADRCDVDRAETIRLTPTPKQQAVAYANESLTIGVQEGLGDDYTVACAIAELHALTPVCTERRAS